MLSIYYDKDGFAHSDFDMYDMVKEFKDNGFDYYKEDNYYIDTCTHNVIDAVRVAIVKGYISHEYVKFVFGDVELKVDKTARPIDGVFPSYFLDHALNQLIGIDENIF